MEKKMIEHYKDSKKSELKFIKNRWRSSRPSNRQVKKQGKSGWRQDKVLDQLIVYDIRK